MNKTTYLQPMSFEVDEKELKATEEVLKNVNSKDNQQIPKLNSFDNSSNIKKESENLLKSIEKIFKMQLTSLIFVFAIFGITLISLATNLALDTLDIYNISLTLGYIYIALWLVVIYFISTFIYSQYSQYSTLKNVLELQQQSHKLNSNPTDEVFHFIKQILNQYKNDSNVIVKKKVEDIQNKINTNKIPKEVLIPVVSEDIIAHLDERAEAIVFKYAKENALMTAISPMAFLDLLIILWRNSRMIKDVAEIYGFKAGLSGNLILMKRVFEQTIFIGVAELTENALTTITGQTFLSKVSSSIAQGAGHGILTIRVGVSAIHSCRPISDLNRISVFEKLLNQLKKTLNPFKK